MDTGIMLAYERTYLALERTQMAWLRTGLALISFGFAIAKFYQYLHDTQGPNAPHLGARTVGMILIAIGLVGLTVANLQHRRALAILRSQCPGLPRSSAGPASWAIMALGMVAFVAALL